MRLSKLKTNKQTPSIIILCFSFLSLFCTSAVINKNESLRFAIINHTRAQSPYSGLDRRLNFALNQIKEDNPVFLVHLGGMVCAGTNWQGITGSDIERQYKEFFSTVSGLPSIFYTVKAGSDLFNNSSDYYNKYTGRKNYYSFNYGNLHFLVLDSSGSLNKEQKEWFTSDLKRYKNSAAIYVFLYDSLFIPEKIQSQLSAAQYKDSEFLHKYFIKYPVKAVFSGNSPLFFKRDIDGISYINTGCGGFNKDEITKGYAQYYIVEYKNGKLLVLPKYLNTR
jgi:hypothetical protein